MTQPPKPVLKSVAIAEDDGAVSKVLTTALTRAGYAVVGTATTGTEATALLQTQKPQLMLLDIHMPSGSGLDVLKQAASLKQTAFVVMTADGDPELAHEALDAGASAYLHKPFDLPQLIPVIESAFHRFLTENRLREETQSLQEALETRKCLDQAKGILMQEQSYSEDQAHRTLLKMSQDQGLPLKDVCLALIRVRQLFSKSQNRGADAASPRRR